MKQFNNKIFINNIEQIVDSLNNSIGISVLHLETNNSFYINPNTSFPMASVYKAPLAIYCLDLEEKGLIDLEEYIEILPKHIRPESGIIAHRFTLPGLKISIKNLIRLMIEVSDNSAADIILDLCGGPAKVNKYLKENNFSNIRINSSIFDWIKSYCNLSNSFKPEDIYSIDQLKELFSKYDFKQAIKQNCIIDSSDTATPLSLAELLRDLKTGKLINQKNTGFLLDSMQRTRTGLNRIRAGLPKNTVVANKTGFDGGVTNDIAIINLPNNLGHLILVILIDEPNLPIDKREKAIADIARYCFNEIVS